MNEMKNQEWKENKPTEEIRTRSPLIHIRKVKENWTLASTMEQKKNVKVADKSGVAVKKLELKKKFWKKEKERESTQQ